MAKQGRASHSGSQGTHRSPISHADNVKAVSQIGQSLGNHATSQTNRLVPVENLGAGRGFQAPQPKSRQHGCGSQGRH